MRIDYIHTKDEKIFYIVILYLEKKSTQTHSYMHVQLFE